MAYNMFRPSTPVGRSALDGIRNSTRAVPDRSRVCRWVTGALSIGAVAVSAAGCVGESVARARCVAGPTPRSSDVARPILVSSRIDRSDATYPIAADGSRSPLEPAALPRVPMDRQDVNLREAGYDVSVGFGVGAVVPGAQDLKFKRYGPGDVLTDFLFSDDIDASTDHLETIDATAWKTRGALDGFGVRVEAARWSTRATAKSFVDRLGTSVAAPPFRSVGEEHVGLFATVAHRWSLSKGNAAEDSPYVFVGLGYGEVYSRVTHGDQLWALAFESYAGVAFPISPGIRFRIEGMFLITHDVDVSVASTDWAVDTSGKHLWGHSTFDTRFYAVTVGFEFRF